MGNILEKDESPALIASGTLFTFPEYNQDAAMYEAPEEFQRFVAQAKRNKGDFVLMSGDVHYSAVHKLSSEVFGHESYEIVASRIHSISPSVRKGVHQISMRSLRL
jgi:phosphodiesterase/alkaline phosphatase D-like protein